MNKIGWIPLRWLFVLFCPFPVIAEETVPEIITAWQQECREITTVRAKIKLYQYHHFLHRQSFGTGELGYAGPGKAFIQINNLPLDADQQALHLSTFEPPYEITPYHDMQWHWKDDRVYAIDERDQSYQEFEVPAEEDQPKNWIDRLNGGRIKLTDFTPFLPGQPEKAVIDQWSFTVTRQNETHVWVQAKRKPQNQRSTSDSHCELYFQSRPVQLLALKTGANSMDQKVYLFSEIDFEPAGWAVPDLCCYQSLNHTASATTKPPSSEEPSDNAGEFTLTSALPQLTRALFVWMMLHFPSR